MWPLDSSEMEYKRVVCYVFEGAAMETLKMVCRDARYDTRGFGTLGCPDFAIRLLEDWRGKTPDQLRPLAEELVKAQGGVPLFQEMARECRCVVTSRGTEPVAREQPVGERQPCGHMPAGTDTVGGGKPFPPAEKCEEAKAQAPAEADAQGRKEQPPVPATASSEHGDTKRGDTSSSRGVGTRQPWYDLCIIALLLCSGVTMIYGANVWTEPTGPQRETFVIMCATYSSCVGWLLGSLAKVKVNWKGVVCRFAGAGAFFVIVYVVPPRQLPEWAGASTDSHETLKASDDGNAQPPSDAE